MSDYETIDGVGQCRRVQRLRFNIKSPQVIFDGWRNRDRICRYYGECVGCGQRCYGFDDGENDPRGMLGDYAVGMFHTSDYDMTGPDVVACYCRCQNDYDFYTRALAIAKKQWTETEGR